LHLWAFLAREKQLEGWWIYYGIKEGGKFKRVIAFAVIVEMTFRKSGGSVKIWRILNLGKVSSFFFVKSLKKVDILNFLNCLYFLFISRKIP